MKHEITPQESNREQAYTLWIKSPMPMVTLTKTFDITRLQKIAKQRHVKLNMLLCWCIGKAASQIEEFYTLPEGDRLFKYDRIAINVIVNNIKGGINSCDIPFVDDLEQFGSAYTTLTTEVKNTCKSIFNEEHMIVGTSAMTATELDSIVNQYTDKFCNPMVMWGRYRKGWFKTTLPISFQFHHVQMDGGHAAQFLELLQKTINSI
ncbi:MAG: chloramphenicol acetyltransferase [Rikenellaceae bacterium]|nr:chloramphenicol acetyltransferase [Rikenellaceae bacterium]